MLIQQEFKAPIFLVPEMIPIGLCFFAGKPKIGKSWFVLALMIGIISGERLLEYFDLEENDDIEVLYLALEDSARRMKDRLEKIAPNLSKDGRASRAKFYFKWPSVEEQGLLALERWLEQHPKCKIVFVDTFAKVRRRPKSSSSYYEDYEAASALKQIADRFEIAIVVVHHVRKAPSDDPFEMISGTNGISGSAANIFSPALCNAGVAAQATPCIAPLPTHVPPT